MSTDPDTSESTLAALEAARILPVVTLDDPADAEPLVDALVAGGVGAIEVALRTPAGLPALAAIGARDDIAVGAGTVLTADDVDRVADTGARFVISPGIDDAVVLRARELGMLPIPGVATATEVQRAMALGLREMKVFPIGQLGGLGLVSALHGPFPSVRFLPSGGVTATDAPLYLAHPAIFAVSGSWMAPSDLIRARDWDGIASIARAAVLADVGEAGV